MPLGPALRSSVPASPANSHIVPIGDRCGEAEHLGEAVAREIRVFPYDVLVRHAFGQARDRKSTRLNSSHGYISYAVFCLKKKTLSTSRVVPFAVPVEKAL